MIFSIDIGFQRILFLTSWTQNWTLDNDKYVAWSEGFINTFNYQHNRLRSRYIIDVTFSLVKEIFIYRLLFFTLLWLREVLINKLKIEPSIITTTFHEVKDLLPHFFINITDSVVDIFQSWHSAWWKKNSSIVCRFLRHTGIVKF